MFTFEEAVAKAKKIDRGYDMCVEHPNAWAFDSDGERRVGGPDAGVVIMKEDGRVLRMYEYYMSDIGSDEVISETRI